MTYCSPVMRDALRVSFSAVRKPLEEVHRDVQRRCTQTVLGWAEDLTVMRAGMDDFVNRWLTWATACFEHARACDTLDAFCVYDDSPVESEELSDLFWKLTDLRNNLYGMAVEVQQDGDGVAAGTFLDMGDVCEAMLKKFDLMSGGLRNYRQWCCERPSIHFDLHLVTVQHGNYIEQQNLIYSSK